ncbi:MAG: hypothetical protein M1575_03920 [Patescibacteria group bacterium]|nr:hypothetical protein [Patescibacteria group bacterium]MCL5095840.1 hypothetical protein [Patescibacteria group bacterium]
MKTKQECSGEYQHYPGNDSRIRFVLPAHDRPRGVVAETSIDQLLPEVRSLYGLAHLGAKIAFYQDATRYDDPRYNHNQVQASRDLIAAIDACEREGRVFKGGLFGPMASGKDSANHNLRRGVTFRGELKGRFQLVRHNLDLGRYSGIVYTQGGVKMGLVPTYKSLEDLIKQSANFPPTTLLVINEFIFAGGTGEKEITEDNFRAFLKIMEDREIHTLFVGLDLDFKLDPWPNILVALPHLDHLAVLSARCNERGCRNVAHFTERRRPILRSGQLSYVPCRMSDEVVKVGTVVKNLVQEGKDQYGAKCQKHHRVYAPAYKIGL